MANFGTSQLDIIADIFIDVINNHCAIFYQNELTNKDTTKILKFLQIFQHNFIILPQNNTFWTYSAWHQS